MIQVVEVENPFQNLKESSIECQLHIIDRCLSIIESSHRYHTPTINGEPISNIVYYPQSFEATERCREGSDHLDYFYEHILGVIKSNPRLWVYSVRIYDVIGELLREY